MSDDKTTAFLTGSRAYGMPREDSDIDICILVDDALSSLLFSASEQKGSSVRFGKLNLIVFSNRKDFERWREVTEHLITQRPVTREEAVLAFQYAGFGNYGESADK